MEKGKKLQNKIEKLKFYLFLFNRIAHQYRQNNIVKKNYEMREQSILQFAQNSLPKDKPIKYLNFNSCYSKKGIILPLNIKYSKGSEKILFTSKLSSKKKSEDYHSSSLKEYIYSCYDKHPTAALYAKALLLDSIPCIATRLGNMMIYILSEKTRIESETYDILRNIVQFHLEKIATIDSNSTLEIATLSYNIVNASILMFEAGTQNKYYSLNEFIGLIANYFQKIKADSIEEILHNLKLLSVDINTTYTHDELSRSQSNSKENLQDFVFVDNVSNNKFANLFKINETGKRNIKNINSKIAIPYFRSLVIKSKYNLNNHYSFKKKKTNGHLNISNSKIIRNEKLFNFIKTNKKKQYNYIKNIYQKKFIFASTISYTNDTESNYSDKNINSDIKYAYNLNTPTLTSFNKSDTPGKLQKSGNFRYFPQNSNYRRDKSLPNVNLFKCSMKKSNKILYLDEIVCCVSVAIGLSKNINREYSTSPFFHTPCLGSINQGITTWEKAALGALIEQRSSELDGHDIPSASEEALFQIRESLLLLAKNPIINELPKTRLQVALEAIKETILNVRGNSKKFRINENVENLKWSILADQGIFLVPCSDGVMLRDSKQGTVLIAKIIKNRIIALEESFSTYRDGTKGYNSIELSKILLQAESYESLKLCQDQNIGTFCSDSLSKSIDSRVKNLLYNNNQFSSLNKKNVIKTLNTTKKHQKTIQEYNTLRCRSLNNEVVIKNKNLGDNIKINCSSVQSQQELLYNENQVDTPLINDFEDISKSLKDNLYTQNKTNIKSLQSRINKLLDSKKELYKIQSNKKLNSSNNFNRTLSLLKSPSYDELPENTIVETRCEGWRLIDYTNYKQNINKTTNFETLEKNKIISTENNEDCLYFLSDSCQESKVNISKNNYSSKYKFLFDNELKNIDFEENDNINDINLYSSNSNINEINITKEVTDDNNLKKLEPLIYSDINKYLLDKKDIISENKDNFTEINNTLLEAIHDDNNLKYKDNSSNFKNINFSDHQETKITNFNIVELKDLQTTLKYDETEYNLKYNYFSTRNIICCSKSAIFGHYESNTTFKDKDDNISIPSELRLQSHSSMDEPCLALVSYWKSISIYQNCAVIREWESKNEIDILQLVLHAGAATMWQNSNMSRNLLRTEILSFNDNISMVLHPKKTVFQRLNKYNTVKSAFQSNFALHNMIIDFQRLKNLENLINYKTL